MSRSFSISCYLKCLSFFRQASGGLIGGVIFFLIIYIDGTPGHVEAQTKQHNWIPELKRIAEVDPVVKAAIELILIPSPSGHEGKLADHVIGKLRGLGVLARKDKYGNVIAKVPASPGYEKVPSLLLTAHMDMVAADRKNPLKPVRPRILHIDGREWIASDGTTTLGADNKVGVATIIDVVARLVGKYPKQASPLKHGPIEIALTTEEETTAKGAIGLDTGQFNSKYTLVLDGEQLFEIVWELASTTEVTIWLRGARGGHSGVDIDHPDNINAIKVLSEIDVRIPQGVVKRNERGVIASINAGLVEGGSATNVIAPEAKIVYLVRSADPVAEKKLLEEIQVIISEIERKYRALQPNFKVDLNIDQSLPPWSAKTDSHLLKLAAETAERLSGQKIYPKSVHAGAEANIYAHKKNSKGETLEPLLLGVANLHAIHTTRERLEWRSLLTGRDWVVEIIRVLADKGGLETRPRRRRDL